MERISKERAEEAIRAYREAKLRELEVRNEIREAEEIINMYALDNIENFEDGSLQMEDATITIRAGVAKPVKDGRPLSSAEREELAQALPPAYTRPACDFGLLFSCEDKIVRQMLKARNIEVVREDRFVVL